jgi:hypothetical protein
MRKLDRFADVDDRQGAGCRSGPEKYFPEKRFCCFPLQLFDIV